QLFDLCGAARLGDLERLGPDQDDRRLSVRTHRGELGASEVRHLRDETAVLRRNVAGVGDEAAAESRGQPARDLSRVGGEAEQDEVWRLLLRERRKRVGGGFGD